MLLAARSVLTSHLAELYSIPMIPLWLCSLVMLTLIFERFRALRAGKILDPQLSQSVVKLAADDNLQQAHEEASQSKTLVGQAWAQGLHEFLLGGVSLEEALTNSTVLAFKPLKRNLQGISTISVIAPLLGLLGTVIGMVLVFDEISVAQNPDKQKMAEGIMVALFTTVLGITIAVPGIVLGRYFASRLVAYAEVVEADIDRIRYRYAHALAQHAKAVSNPITTPESPTV